MIYSAITTLAGAGTPRDVVTVSEQLERRGQLVDAGGLAYLGTLASETPTAANIHSCAAIVAERSRLRRLQDIGAQIAEAVRDRCESTQILARMQEQMQALRPAPRNEMHTAIELSAFLDLELSKPEPLVGDLARKGSLLMVHSKTGIGKTWLLLGIGVATSHGVPILGYDVKTPRPVLYVDGEMVATDMQHRLAELVKPIRETINHMWEPFHLVTPDLQKDGVPIPKIDTPEGQAHILRLVDQFGPGLVEFDNLSCLTDPEDDNAAGSWSAVQGLLLTLRRRGIAVIVGHHSGKGGEQRGTSRRADILDIVLKLTSNTDIQTDGRTRVTVEFEKGRGLSSQQKETFMACLEPHPAGGLVWSRGAGASMADRIRQMLLDGMSPGDISSELKCARSFAYRIREQLIAAGELLGKTNKASHSRRRTVPLSSPKREDSGDKQCASPRTEIGDKQGTAGDNT